jgi:hypothetical protein
MKFVISALIALSGLAANAASVRLGSATLDQNDSSTTIDARNVGQVDSITLSVRGAASIEEVRVVYRTGTGFGKYVSTKFKVNKYVNNGAIALDLPDNGYPVRRIEIKGTAAGFGEAVISAIGSN